MTGPPSDFLRPILPPRGAAPPPIVLLGPQRFSPTLGRAVARLGLGRPIATVTAGWQEREDDDRELDEHLGGGTVNLRLHGRGEDLFAADPELADAYRARQERLQQLQDFYRIRLELSIEAARIINRRKADERLLAEEGQASIEAIRGLDAQHVERCRGVQAEFDARWRLSERPSVARHRAEVAALIQGAAALAIAGGHVAVLLNRLKLFGVAPGDKPVLAWSAGAMAVSERVVLFHDSPPQGPGVAEILEAGLGLCTGVVALPNPQMRLRLDDPERVSLTARRFAPAACLAMGNGASITYRGRSWSHASGIIELGAGGELLTLEAL